MTLPAEVLSYLETVACKYSKNIQLLPKSSSKLMKAIGWIFGITKISPQFMERYYTTIGETIYAPDSVLENPVVENLVRTVAHEAVHIADSNRLTGALFKFLYLFPQSMASVALISLLAPLSLKFLWCLLFLLCLAPLPAPFRYLFELRAYRMQILFSRKEDKLTDEQMVPIYEWIEKQMCTSLYYWTWPFPKTVRKHLQNETWTGTGIYKDTLKWIVIRKVVAALKDNQDG
jgi:hypothetical protein